MLIKALDPEEGLCALSLHAEGLEDAEPARKMEIELYAREMLLPGECVFCEGARELEVAMDAAGFALTLSLREGAPHTLRVAHEQLLPLMREYIDTVRAIAKAGGVERLEALDMAKKITHDKAGRTIERACRPLGIDHATARRFFSLFLSLRYDTTKLTGIHGHRVIR